MVYRVYVEKKPAEAAEARALLQDLRTFLGLTDIHTIRILNRYDAENLEEALFETAISNVFSEPQLDLVSREPTWSAEDSVFAVEYLPGQFDQRADSAAQCIQIMAQCERPLIRTAKVYVFPGGVSAETLAAVKRYVVNPVESREASLDEVETIRTAYDEPDAIPTLDGFTVLSGAELSGFIAEYGLAMDLADITFLQAYFKGEGRDPTLTEIRMIDTYWSDHCRHTTFLTTIDRVSFEDAQIEEAYASYCQTRRTLGREKPVNLMDLATIAAKHLKKIGKLSKLDESEEINACTVKMTVTVDGEPQDYLLLFKNETHNHPTEIEPFGGAATCIGGAIRDPLSGRAYVYAAMRVTGAADPTRPVEETRSGKLPQKKLVTTAAAGYSSYGNQIGIATGEVAEWYHPGYAAKRLEIGAVIGAVPKKNVRRECPQPGDVVILLGGRTGRDGIGGATGSSKSHTEESLGACGAEVQKGNAPEERKLQRLFRNDEASRLIKRCNDFGAGGVSVAIGELADGLVIQLDAVPKKYAGLDGTELAISESQERMAVVVDARDKARLFALADAENLEATEVAVVQASPRLVLLWKGQTVADVSREFLNSNGAEKHIQIETARPQPYEKTIPEDFGTGMRALAGDLNVCSKRGLSERFDSTIGAGAVLMPFGGTYQLTPEQAMVTKISVEHGDTEDCSFMAWGYNPFISEKNPYHGAYLAVVESVSKLIAAGAEFEDVYLTLQEYFEKPLRDARRWGKPMAALLGAFRAQMDYEIAAIGGKDSMSGSFEELDVPPTLVSFAVTTGKTSDVTSSAFKAAGNRVLLIAPRRGADGLPIVSSERACFQAVTGLIRSKKAAAVRTLGYGGVAEAVLKMCMGNGVGFRFRDAVTLDALFQYGYGAFLVELNSSASVDFSSDICIMELGETADLRELAHQDQKERLSELIEIYENRLESVFPCRAAHENRDVRLPEHTVQTWEKAPRSVSKPRVLIPVFPGTNCEYDTQKALCAAGAEPEIFVIRNLTASAIAESVAEFARRIPQSQMIFIPGGFSGGDEPEGSGKFITAFFRNGVIEEQVNELLKTRKGLMCGVCNGFQALIKLGLLTYGEIRESGAEDPTLTYNTIARHQSRIARTRIVSNRSPFFALTKPGEVYEVPISHGEGRFLASDAWICRLSQQGQIATQYADLDGNAAMDIACNPNNSAFAVEGMTSPDGRVLGKMGHSERVGSGLYQNVPGAYDMGLFRSAVQYFG